MWKLLLPSRYFKQTNKKFDRYPLLCYFLFLNFILYFFSIQIYFTLRYEFRFWADTCLSAPLPAPSCTNGSSTVFSFPTVFFYLLGDTLYSCLYLLEFQGYSSLISIFVLAPISHCLYCVTLYFLIPCRIITLFLKSVWVFGLISQIYFILL